MATLVYAGMRVSRDNKKVHTYYNPETKDHATFDKVLVTGSGYVGALIECEISEDGTTYRKAKLVGHTSERDPWNCDELLGYWQITDRISKDTIQMYADVKKFEGDPVNELIEKLRRRLAFTASRQEKLRIARYVFEQLIK